MPAFGDLFTDVRGGDRTMRVSYHDDRGVVVLSLWAGATCRASFRLAVGDVGNLIAVLSQIEAAAPPDDTEAGDPAPAETGSVTLPEGSARRDNPGIATRSIVPRVA